MQVKPSPLNQQKLLLLQRNYKKKQTHKKRMHADSQKLRRSFVALHLLSAGDAWRLKRLFAEILIKRKVLIMSKKGVEKRHSETAIFAALYRAIANKEYKRVT